MQRRSAIRADMQPRYWHILLCMIIGTGIFTLNDWMHLAKFGDLPTLKSIWGFAVIVPLLTGAVVTLGAGGAPLWKRIAGSALCGVAVGVFSSVVSGLFSAHAPIEISTMAIIGVWRAFVFSMIGVLGVLLTEIKMPEPRQE